jgi:uncharacterized repeat protein (TIGR04138 family)
MQGGSAYNVSQVATMKIGRVVCLAIAMYTVKYCDRLGSKLGAFMEIDIFELANRTKYPVEAFGFLQRGLDFSVRKTHGELKVDPEIAIDTDIEADSSLHADLEEEMESRHVSGEQLCWGLRDYAVDQYGLMAQTVLRRWNITKCDDFGHMVFAMVDAEMMRKTDRDNVEDFFGVYDFSDAFVSDLTLSDNSTGGEHAI